MPVCLLQLVFVLTYRTPPAFNLYLNYALFPIASRFSYLPLLPSFLSPPSQQFQLSRDYSTSGDHPLSLKKGDVVEVLDNKIEERWFVRTQSASPEAGWVPPTVLVPIGKEETDGKSSRAKITSGESVSTSRVWGGSTCY